MVAGSTCAAAHVIDQAGHRLGRVDRIEQDAFSDASSESLRDTPVWRCRSRRRCIAGR